MRQVFQVSQVPSTAEPMTLHTTDSVPYTFTLCAVGTTISLSTKRLMSKSATKASTRHGRLAGRHRLRTASLAAKECIWSHLVFAFVPALAFVSTFTFAFSPIFVLRSGPRRGLLYCFAYPHTARILAYIPRRYIIYTLLIC